MLDVMCLVFRCPVNLLKRVQKTRLPHSMCRQPFLTHQKWPVGQRAKNLSGNGLSDLDDQRSTGITGRAARKKQVAAAFHDGFFDSLDDRAPRRGCLGVAVDQ